MSLNEIRCLPSCGSTNAYAKEHIEEFGPVAAVYTTSQTSGRGRLGRLWTNAAGQALYYTAVLKVPMVQPETLPLFASLAVREQLRLRYGVECAIKWPNDLLLGGKKVVGILCEAVNYGTGGGGRAPPCGIGIHPAPPPDHFRPARPPPRPPPAPSAQSPWVGCLQIPPPLPLPMPFTGLQGCGTGNCPSPLRRFSCPWNMAKHILFLASGKASRFGSNKLLYPCGESLCFPGGWKLSGKLP